MTLLDELNQTPKYDVETYDSLVEMALITNRFVREFRALGVPVWGPIVLHFLKERMPSETHLAWEIGRKHHEMPTVDQAVKFLLERAEELKQPKQPQPQSLRAATVTTPPTPQSCAVQKPTTSSRTQSKVQTENPNITCRYWQGGHPITLCAAFRKLSLEERKKEVWWLGLCENCFSPEHTTLALSCKKRSCKVCAGLSYQYRRHNTLLCPIRPSHIEPNEQISQPSEEQGAQSLQLQAQKRAINEPKP